MYIEYPNQRVSLKEKQTPKWYRAMYDYIIARAVADRDIEKVKNRILNANGVVSESEFQYLTKPVNTSGVNIEMPGKIRDIDFINPIREKAISAYSQLPNNFQVKVSNPDVTIKRTVQLREAFEDIMYAKFAEFINGLIQGQQQGGQPPTEQQQDFNKFKEEFLENWMDDRAIMGQHIINTINDVNDYDYNRLKAYTYWWMCEEFYTRRHIEGNNVIWEVIPPQEIYIIENGEEFIEDQDAIVRMYPMTYVDFMNKLPDLLEKEQYDILKQHIDRHETGYYHMPMAIFRMFKDVDATDTREEIQLTNNAGDFTLCHIEFKSEREVKELIYLNPIGKEISMIVSDDYVLQPELGDIRINSIWISEVYEGYKIGEESDAIYVKPRPLDVQRRDENNPRKVKLSYGGKKGLMNDILINPIASRLTPYLVYYKIIHLHIERTLAKYQSSIKFIPKILIEGDDDMSRKDKVWYMKADNTMIYDHTEISPNEVSQGVIIKGDPDVSNYIKSLLELRASMKQEAWELANMNDEMVGQGDPRGNVTNNQANIAMAKMGSILSTKIFNKAIAKDLLANLEFSKVAFKEKNSGSYGTTQGEIVYYDIDPNTHNETSYGMTVTDSDADERQLREYKEFAFNASQNGDLDVAFEAISSENVSGVRKVIRNLIKTTKEFKDNMAKQEQQIAAENIAREDARQDKILASQETIATMNNSAKIEEALIKSDIELLKLESTDKDEDGKDDDTEMMIKQASLRLNERAQSLAEAKHYEGSSMNSHKKAMDKEKLAVQKAKPKSGK